MAGELWRQFEGEVIEQKYHLVNLISAGSYGGVFLADHRLRDRQIRRVAVKLMTPEEDAEDQLRELVEATNLHHPHLLRCFDAGATVLRNVDLYYLVMEVATDSLKQVISDRPLALAEVRHFALSVLSGLEYLHAHQMVHCDVKPGNLLRVGDTWKLADFGLLRLLAQSSMVKTRSLLGSAAYMPPEGYGGVITPAWDVWSFGVTLVEALTRRRPFQANTEAEFQQQILNGEPNLPGLPVPFDAIARGCLVKDYRARWTVPQIQAALRPAPVAAEVPPVAPPPPKPPQLKRAADANRTALLWVLALVPIFLFGAIVFRPKGKSIEPSTAVVRPEETPQTPTRNRPNPAATPEPEPDSPKPAPVVVEPEPTPKPEPKPEPSAPVADPGPAPAAIAAPENRRAEEGAIYAFLDEWVDSVKNKDINTQVNCYAPRVEQFFTKSNVTLAQVRREKEAVFNDLDEIRKYDIRNVNIDSLTATQATISFDKEWDTVGRRHFSGSERGRLRLDKSSGRWKIVSEQEVMVYWVKRE